MTDEQGTSGAILVVGGGISGLTAALEAAEVGNDVFIIDKNPYFGGRVAQLNEYFPKMCPPTCGLEINFKRIKSNRRIRTYTMATAAEGRFIHPADTSKDDRISKDEWVAYKLPAAEFATADKNKDGLIDGLS